MTGKKTTFEEDIKRLEIIVQQLESGIGIEEAIKLYEEGIKLSSRLETRLSDIERKVYAVKNIQELDEEIDDVPDMELFQ